MFSSSLSSTTTRKMRWCVAGAAVSESLMSHLSEDRAGKPTCRHREDYRRNAIECGLSHGELENLGAEAHLADSQRRGLGTDHIAVADQEHADGIGPGRHISREVDVGAEQPLAKESHLSQGFPIEPLFLLVADQRLAELPDAVRRSAAGRQGCQTQMPKADLVPGQHRVSDDLLQRPVGGDAVE